MEADKRPASPEAGTQRTECQQPQSAASRLHDAVREFGFPVGILLHGNESLARFGQLLFAEVVNRSLALRLGVLEMRSDSDCIRNDGLPHQTLCRNDHCPERA